MRNSRGLQPLAELGHDAGGVEPAFDVAARSEPEFLKEIDVLQADHVAAGSRDLADVGDAAGAVAHARDLNDEVNGRCDLRANSLLRQGDRAHHGHGLDAGDGIAGIVGMDGGDGSVVPGVHGLQHIQRLFAADLAEDDAVGPHAQRVDDELPLPNGALAFQVGRPALQAGDVLLLDLQFRGVLDGDDAFRRRR